MNINRDNYETFFLLYTDNELSGAERKAVDAFVVSNPDLLEELEMLQQSILLPDNITFDFKKSLLKTELISSDIQEKLLLHLDNELSATEKNEIEQLIKKEAGVEREWSDLQAVKFNADEIIVFENKELLYRKESGRLVAFPWRKLAAAAVLIGFGIWGGMQYLKNEPRANKGEFATKNKKIPADIIQLPTQQIIATDTSASIKGDDIATTNDKTITIPPTTDNATQAFATKKYRGSEVESNDKETFIAVQQKDNNLPKPYSENVNNNTGNNSIIATVTPLKQPNASIDPVQKVVTNNTARQDAANEYVSVASFTENNEESNNHVLFIDEEKVKKTKIGGFFRKVKRVVERTTNIKTGGNNFKVANLEFTIQ